MTPHATDSFVKSHLTLFDADEELALFTKWKETSNPKLFEKIILNYTPLIKKAVKDLSGYKIDPRELTSEGLLALVDAAHRFDLSRGLRFSTFAKSWIKGMLLAYITKNYFMVNVCTSAGKKKLFFSLRRMIAQQQKIDGSFEMTEELANKLATDFEVDVKEIYNMNGLFRSPYESLSAPVGEEEGTSKEDMLVSNTPTPEESLHRDQAIKFHKKIVDEALLKLTDRERFVFVSQVLQDGKGRTLEEIGVDLNISKERVRQIRNQAQIKFDSEVKRITKTHRIAPADMF